MAHKYSVEKIIFKELIYINIINILNYSINIALISY